MRTLADECLAALPRLMAIHPLGPTVAILADALSADSASVRAAARQLAASWRAIVCRRGTGGAWHLLPLGDPTPVCVVCKRAFQHGRKSAAVTCSRSCANSLGWRDPEKRAVRLAELSAAQSTPKAQARTAAHNRRRWAKPEEHAKLSEQNRRRWADPISRAKQGMAFKKANGTPEKRKFYADIRRAEWADPKQRAKRIAALNNGLKQTPEYRAHFSALLKARWQDPVFRAKWTDANRRRNDRVRGKKMTAEQLQRRRETRARNAARSMEASP